MVNIDNLKGACNTENLQKTMQSQRKMAAFLFPGQGVQVNGVIEYYRFLKNKNPDSTDKLIKLLQDSLDEINPQGNFNVLEILENDSSPSWAKTSFVQPLTYILSILTFEFVKNSHDKPAYLLGHSFGAFSALTAAVSLPMNLGIRIVAARGKFMQEESEKANMGMCAIIGLREGEVEEICEKTKAVIALINAPTAFVVGSSRDVFSKIEQEAARLGATKVIRLSISGAFHTKAMQGAYQKFKQFFKEYSLKNPEVPVVTNIGGLASSDPEELKNDVIESMINPVNWARMVDFLKKNGVTYFIECGPGTSLSALSRMNGVDREKIVHAKNMLE